jgi:hypothetical protein
VNAERLITVLELALGGALADEEFDVLLGVDEDEPDAIEVTADEWTLHVERWPGGAAFIALDLEPEGENPGEQNVALRKALGGAIGALAAADDSLEGALVAALRASGDPLSARLAALLDEMS